MAENIREEIRRQLHQLGAPEDRLSFYLGTLTEILMGTASDENAVRLTAYAPEIDTEVAQDLLQSEEWNLLQTEMQERGTEIYGSGTGYEETITQLAAMGSPMGIFFSERMRASDIVTDAGFIFSDLPAIVGGIVVAGGLAAFSGYWGISAGAGLRSVLTQAPVVGRIFRGGGAKAAGGAAQRSLRSRVLKGGLVAGGILGAYGLGMFGEKMPGMSGSEEGTTTPTTAPPGINDATPTTAPPLYMVDPTGAYTGVPGSTIELDPNDLTTGVTTIPGLNQGTATTTPTGLPSSLSPDLTDLLGQYPGAMASYLGTMMALGEQEETWNPLIIGERQVSPNAFPYGISLAGRVLVPQESYTGAAGTEAWNANAPEIPLAAQRYMTEEDVQGSALSGMRIPPGATINPTSTGMWGDRSLLQLGAQAASSYHIPVEILYGIINQDSGWNPYAVGDNGNSHGLAQIYLPDNPNISENMAANPVFALPYTAGNLARDFRLYGSWEAAVLAHRNPEGAKYLASTGNFASTADREYVLGAITSAYSSGLGNVMFGGMNSLLNSASVSGGGSGRVVPPFQEPDRDDLRQFIRKAYDAVLTRRPTEGELERTVTELITLYKSAYEESIKGYYGQESREINPEAALLERLEQSGEAEFRQDAEQNTAMSEYLADIAAIMRGST